MWSKSTRLQVLYMYVCTHVHILNGIFEQAFSHIFIYVFMLNKCKSFGNVLFEFLCEDLPFRIIYERANTYILIHQFVTP